jgi:ribosomal protein L11
LAATNKLTGVSVKLLAENFREVGVSIYDVSDQMKEVVNYAKSVGVSVSGVAGKSVRFDKTNEFIQF